MRLWFSGSLLRINSRMNGQLLPEPLAITTCSRRRATWDAACIPASVPWPLPFNWMSSIHPSTHFFLLSRECVCVRERVRVCVCVSVIEATIDHVLVCPSVQSLSLKEKMCQGAWSASRPSESVGGGGHRNGHYKEGGTWPSAAVGFWGVTGGSQKPLQRARISPSACEGWDERCGFGETNPLLIFYRKRFLPGNM